MCQRVSVGPVVHRRNRFLKPLNVCGLRHRHSLMFVIVEGDHEGVRDWTFFSSPPHGSSLILTHPEEIFYAFLEEAYQIPVRMRAHEAGRSFPTLMSSCHDRTHTPAPPRAHAHQHRGPLLSEVCRGPQTVAPGQVQVHGPPRKNL